MTDVKLFDLDGENAKEIPGSASGLEKTLQRQIEGNLETMLGVRFLGTEYPTGPKHGGRIDTLGIDENSSPVIIEYKRATNENVINQGLFYLDWLLDHRAEFKLLVIETLGDESAKKIEWTAPRLLCIAGGFTRYDEHAVQQMNRNIELIRFRRFGDKLLMLELVNTTAAKESNTDGKSASPVGSYKTISDTLGELDGSLEDLYQTVRAHLLALGDDVQEKTLKYYVAFKRLRNFACVEVHSKQGVVTVYLKVSPEKVQLEQGFTSDVRNVGHYGTDDLRVTLRNHEDLKRAIPLLQESYEAS